MKASMRSPCVSFATVSDPCTSSAPEMTSPSCTGFPPNGSTTVPAVFKFDREHAVAAIHQRNTSVHGTPSLTVMTPRNAIVAGEGAPPHPFRPSERDLARERCIDMWRGRLMYATTAFQRKVALNEIERLRAQRPPAMVEWVKAGGWTL